VKAVVDAEVQIVGERGSEVEAGVRPCAEQAVEVGGHVPRDEATGPVEDLAPDRHAALGPFGDVVVHGNLGEVREDGQPLPVGEKALEGGPTARREAVLPDLPPGSGVHFIQNLEKGSIERRPGASGIFRKSDQTVGVGPVKAGNEALPGVGPFAPVRMPGPGFHEVSAGMGPAEAEDESRLDAGRGLVGRIAVDDQEALEILEVRLGNGGAPGGVEDEDDGIDRQKAPEPPSVALFPLDLLENLKSRLVRVGEGGRPGACEKRLVKGKVKTGDPGTRAESTVPGDRTSPDCSQNARMRPRGVWKEYFPTRISTKTEIPRSPLGMREAGAGAVTILGVPGQEQVFR